MPFEREKLFRPTGIDTHQADVHFANIDALMAFQRPLEQAMNSALAEVGAQAGAEAGANRQGGLRPAIGPGARAYNEAFLRSYTLDVYADTEQDFLRLEQEAAGDPDKFAKSATARREAILAEVDPSVRPYIDAAIRERVGAATSRLRLSAMAQAEAGMKESTIRGLDAIRRDVSRYLSAGDDVSRAKGMALAQEYGRQVDLGVRDGIFTPAEGQKMVEAALKANATDLALGRFNLEASRPGGDPVRLIRETLESDDPAFDDADRQALGAEMMRRLGQQNMLMQAEVARQEAEMRARWAATEQEATIRLLNGTLTTSWLSSKVASGAMDPQLARTMREAAAASGLGADEADDPTQLAGLAADWRTMTTDQVLAMPGLSWKTRIEYVGKIADKEADWRDSDPVQEARARIDRELGTSDVAIGLASDPVKLRRSLALTRLDRDLAALPPEEREAKAIEVADAIITEVIRGDKTKALEGLQARRNRKIARVLQQEGVASVAELDAEQRAELDKDLARLDQQAEELRSELAR